MPGHTLKISGLSSAVSEETVRTVFSTFGKVIESRKESKGNKGERATTFVTFVHSEDAMEAVRNMHESMLYGSPVQVALVQV
jgi:RNA recognition motif-containing protein